MPKLELAVFDWGGVVSDSPALQVEAEQLTAGSFAEEYGFEFDIDAIDWTRFQGWGRIKIAKELFGVDDESADKFRQKVVDTTVEIMGPHNLSPVVGAARFLDYLRFRSVPVAVATSSNRKILDASIKQFGLDCFVTTVAHQECIDDKPLPGQYREIMRRLNARPENTLVIEDSISGIAAGRYAGAMVVGLTSTLSFEALRAKSDAHIVAHDFPHAAELLQPYLC